MRLQLASVPHFVHDIDAAATWSAQPTPRAPAACLAHAWRG
jgi:hypothetical protein